MHLLQGIEAELDEVLAARVLFKPLEPPMYISQLPLLAHQAEHCPALFQKKLWVSPAIFDAILDQISGHSIFSNNSNNPQLPVAIQLAIFLNRAGHYGNASSPEDVCQWAGVSVGSVIKCTNHVMVALLDQHDTFMQFPLPNSQNAQRCKSYVSAHTCPEWMDGYLVADGSHFPLYTKPGFYGETFFDRKSKYSLNCQVGFHLWGLNPLFINV
jgi:hypothetical protein